MSIKYSVRFYKDEEVRAIWNEENSKWWFSAVDIVGIISGSDRPKKYCSDLKKTKLESEGSEVSEKIGQSILLSTNSYAPDLGFMNNFYSNRKNSN